MSPKGILIAFLVVSLLLIGIMFLVVDGRNNTVLEKSPITKTSTPKEAIETLERENSQEATKPKEDSKLDAFGTMRTINLNEDYNVKQRLDSLKSVIQSKEFTELKKFSELSEKLITQIQDIQQTLFPGGLDKHDIGESPEIQENNAVFFTQKNNYTETATQFLAKLDAFENAIRMLKQKYSQLQNVQAEVREAYTGGQNWLDYNFKDFPAIASYAKLKLLEDAIKTKQKEVLMAVLRNE
ncbi:hypothetical protein KORDIASMS9_00301 [Kordia sp. SMS9]|uniref:hypothetical protein n=1 Tax=Kordia sp. SMS9 TaxID=2282170 RepID=UPI000E0D36D9|nr:hypothetical protein [Kordia sp. SMS9]AXG68111.1 hypothetical protein KORDIASMS9_00301 [Kordia sp. SMS9]